MPSTDRAEIMARAAHLFDQVRRADVVQHVHPRQVPKGTVVPDGYSAWRVGDNSAIIVLPAPAEDAPMSFLRRYLARIKALATGRCPVCDQVALPIADPEERPAAWNLLPIHIEIRHDDGCPVLFTEDDEPYFDPRAREAIE